MPTLLKSLGILALGCLVVYGLFHLVGMDVVRAATGVALFALLGATALLKETKSG